MYTPSFTIIDDIKTPKETPKETPKDIILSLIRNNPKVTVQEMADALSMNKRNAQKHVNALSEAGTIKRIGAARSGYWEIIEI